MLDVSQDTQVCCPTADIRHLGHSTLILQTFAHILMKVLVTIWNRSTVLAGMRKEVLVCDKGRDRLLAATKKERAKASTLHSSLALTIVSVLGETQLRAKLGDALASVVKVDDEVACEQRPVGCSGDGFL